MKRPVRRPQELPGLATSSCWRQPGFHDVDRIRANSDSRARGPEGVLRGIAVDASAATFVGGSTSDLGSGAWVVVTGKVQGDVVKADRFEFIAPPVAQVVKLKGKIRNYDAAVHTFHFLGLTLKLGESVE